MHRPIKAEYRKEEAKLMLEKLRERPTKIPALERDDMMNMLALSVRNVNQNLNIASTFKSVWVTNALDGSVDYLVSGRIFSMVGDSMRGFRSEMLKVPCPKTSGSCEKTDST
jgi:hypothetical protein